MTFDAKWLDFLKASGGKTAAVAGACAVFLLLPNYKVMPTPPTWTVFAAWFGLLLAGFLTVGSILSAVIRVVPVHRWISAAIDHRRTEKAVRDYIPFMTPIERRIIAYLLANNQKVFTATQDGGHAATLLSRGIVMIALRPGQVFSGENVPMGVPEPVWKVLAKHRERFPITAGEIAEGHPWRVHWQERI